jgi:K+-sensing histidine kinase KdpD
VIRQATALAGDQDADLVVVHVLVDSGLNRGDSASLDRLRGLVAEVGGSYTEVSAESPARGLADAVRRSNAGWVVVARHRSRLNELVHGSVAGRLRRLLPDVEVIEVDGSEA